MERADFEAEEYAGAPYSILLRMRVRYMESKRRRFGLWLDFRSIFRRLTDLVTSDLIFWKWGIHVSRLSNTSPRNFVFCLNDSGRLLRSSCGSIFVLYFRLKSMQ